MGHPPPRHPCPTPPRPPTSVHQASTDNLSLCCVQGHPHGVEIPACWSTCAPCPVIPLHLQLCRVPEAFSGTQSLEGAITQSLSVASPSPLSPPPPSLLSLPPPPPPPSLLLLHQEDLLPARFLSTKCHLLDSCQPICHLPDSCQPTATCPDSCQPACHLPDSCQSKVYFSIYTPSSSQPSAD